ncbi:reticulocalbin-2-like [Ostrea edulis]|uniref:reticulocalbin-2-like n=1 Tax=Ostrea edulis TaxID=37623 RepID=UPI0020957A97|nr:reticulocalbin-2-like [Ostrea edulis]
MRLLFIWAFMCTVHTVLCTQEDVAHGGHGKDQHNPIHKEHYHDGEHDSHYDHEAILGDRQLEKEFDEMEPEEAKRRLKVLAVEMDSDKDGFVSRQELIDWIMNSFRKLDMEDSMEQFEECDENNDNKVTWREYLSRHHGFNINDYKEYSNEQEAVDEFTKVLEEDKKKFDAADVDKDGALTKKEHVAFLYPADFPHMHDVEMERVLMDHDKNGDGTITKEEFLADTDKNDKELVLVEEERFGDFDRNKDGVLDKKEIKDWVLPDNNEAAVEEAEHLIQRSDMAGENGKDGKLSIEEIVSNHEDFVGSQATNYGEFLPKDEL